MSPKAGGQVDVLRLQGSGYRVERSPFDERERGRELEDREGGVTVALGGLDPCLVKHGAGVDPSIE